jgi:hypothetical protein
VIVTPVYIDMPGAGIGAPSGATCVGGGAEALGLNIVGGAAGALTLE